MTTDRIERVREKARETAEDYFPLRDGVGFIVDGSYDGQRGYIDGAVFGADAYRTLTDTEWKAMREIVAQLMVDGLVAWSRLSEGSQRSYRHMADAAMTAMGFRREGE